MTCHHPAPRSLAPLSAELGPGPQSDVIDGVKVLWIAPGRSARDETAFRHALATGHRLRAAGERLKDATIINAYERAYTVAQAVGADGREPDMPRMEDRLTMARRVRGYVTSGTTPMGDKVRSVRRVCASSKTDALNSPRISHALSLAHAVWALREPITRTEYARRQPIALGAAVVEGLRRSVEGDAGYSGLITKNPAHAAWEPHWITDELRSLDQLQEHLEDAGFMPSASWKRSKHRNTVGLGRNCSIFESARTWAYRDLRHYFGAPQMFEDAVLTHVLELNADFPEPLPYSEAKAIATSISRWVITRSRMWADGPAVYEATFSTIQAARGRKGGASYAPSARRNQIIREELV